ncbi:MAG TPA: phage major capsid protein [Phycisphaerae bacterium]|nr:phage major capsid protein [Phycisphaerae bacterium]
MTGEEVANYDKYLSDAADLLARAERMEQLETAEGSLAAAVKPASQHDRIASDGGESRKDDKADRENRAFEAYLANDANKMNAEQRALQSDLDVSGGFTVAPPQFVSDLIKAVDNLLFFRQMARVIPVTSSDALVGVSLDNDPADASWTSEIASVSEDSTMDFGGRSLQPHPLRKLLKVSRKLMGTSALPIESLVRDRLTYKLGVPQESAFMTGTGANQPLGVFTASALGISTGRDVSTDNTTTEMRFDNLKRVKYTLKSQYHAAANWIYHRDAVSQLSRLKDGDGQYIWQASVVGGDPDRLLNFPVRMSEYAPNTYTTGLYTMILGDFSNYWIAELQSIAIQRLDELYAATRQIGFIVEAEIDGMPVLEEAFVRVKLG